LKSLKQVYDDDDAAAAAEEAEIAAIMAACCAIIILVILVESVAVNIPSFTLSAYSHATIDAAYRSSSCIVTDSGPNPIRALKLSSTTFM